MRCLFVVLQLLLLLLLQEKVLLLVLLLPLLLMLQVVLICIVSIKEILIVVAASLWLQPTRMPIAVFVGVADAGPVAARRGHGAIGRGAAAGLGTICRGLHIDPPV
jgi:hypothetical protein